MDLSTGILGGDLRRGAACDKTDLFQSASADLNFMQSG
jgi:hypothetical protein